MNVKLLEQKTKTMYKLNAIQDQDREYKSKTKLTVNQPLCYSSISYSERHHSICKTENTHSIKYHHKNGVGVIHLQ